MTTYRLSWESVNGKELWRYSDADPILYKNTTQIVPNSQIPDEHWHKAGPVEFDSEDDHGRMDQHRTLAVWEASDKGFVRNVVLERQVSTPTWEVVES